MDFTKSLDSTPPPEVVDLCVLAARQRPCVVADHGTHRRRRHDRGGTIPQRATCAACTSPSGAWKRTRQAFESLDPSSPPEDKDLRAITPRPRPRLVADHRAPRREATRSRLQDIERTTRGLSTSSSGYSMATESTSPIAGETTCIGSREAVCSRPRICTSPTPSATNGSC